MARPKKEVNWDLVEKKMEAGCSAKEISSSLHINIDTFYDRFKEEFGAAFSDYSDKFYSAGNGNIKFTQYMKALSGNINMLIWLGKLRLGQKDPSLEENTRSNIIVNINGNLGSGIKVSTPTLPDTTNSCSE